MKVLGIFLGMFFLFFLPVWANVHEGSSTSTVDIQTNTSGDSGSVSTHVETNVNGHVQNFDSDKPGNYHVTNNGTTSSVTNMSTGQTVATTPTATSSPTPTTQPLSIHKSSSSFWVVLTDFIKFLFHFS